MFLFLFQSDAVLEILEIIRELGSRFCLIFPERGTTRSTLPPPPPPPPPVNAPASPVPPVPHSLTHRLRLDMQNGGMCLQW